MLKLIITSIWLLIAGASEGQYIYRGRVIKGRTGEFMRYGNVHVPMGTHRESRIGKKVAEIDSFGYFSVSLKDSANVRFFIDCDLDGYAVKTVSHQDSVILFVIAGNCFQYNREKAKRDILENKIYLLFNGTVADIPEPAGDKVFQAKYGVRLVNLYDTPVWWDCIRLYNSEVARFLDEKYGKSWREEIRCGIQFD